MIKISHFEASATDIKIKLDVHFVREIDPISNEANQSLFALAAEHIAKQAFSHVT